MTENSYPGSVQINPPTSTFKVTHLKSCSVLFHTLVSGFLQVKQTTCCLASFRGAGMLLPLDGARLCLHAKRTS